MPNHITNILTIKGEHSEIEKCLKAISSEENEIIDFNKIVPRPKSLDITSGSNVDNAMAIIKNDDKHFRSMLDYPWVKKEGLMTIEQVKEHIKGSLSEKDYEEGRMAIENLEAYGCKDWYSWSIQNWGTKWNAYDCNNDDWGTISFDTAWSTPFPVMKELAGKYPDLSFEVKFADEDLGSNCGKYTFENGELIEEYQPEGTEALKYACEIKGYEFVDFILDNFEYWELDTIKENKQTIVQMLSECYASELVDQIDIGEESGREKAEYLLQLAVENELFEEAAHISRLLNIQND
jgi:hypothetical protein